MMQRALRPSDLVPRGSDVESAFCDGATTVITVRPRSDKSLCPGCGATSGRIHGRYQRCPTDLPLAGGRFAWWSWRVASAASPLCAVDVFSPRGSMMGLWRRGRGERRGWIFGSITLGLPWVAAQPQVLPVDLCCP